MGKIKNKIKKFFKILGPGVITGAADDDPSGIATYTQAGAQFGLGQLWSLLLTLPLMTAIQEASARIGAVTGQGLASVIKKHYGKKIVYFMVFILLIANTVNIGTDLGAMAAATQLIIPAPFFIILLLFTIMILVLEIFTAYRTYQKILKWLALTLLAYPLTVIMLHASWSELLIATFKPQLEWSFMFFFVITGVLGTTISPYIFFWEASEEVENEKLSGRLRAGQLPRISDRFISALRWDNFIGMLFSQFTAWCIVVVAAVVLHQNGLTDVSTAAEAAKSLEPLVNTFPNAGFLAKLIFTCGIVGLGLLAVPVLSGSSAYALSETFNWREGLNLKLKRAHGFYGVITIATLVGLFINFIGLDPIKALVVTAVINGVVSIPLIFIITHIAGREDVMGKYRSGKLSKTLCWLTFLVMLAACVAMFTAMFLN
jgi:NRAMP (natural resistance-associated macrophage protein)-like metal ion transporter